jgi:ribose transport system permease protein
MGWLLAQMKKASARLPMRSSLGILCATVLLFVFGRFIQPQSVSGSAIRGMLPFAAILAIVALGQTLVIQQGGIDLSVPGTVSLSVVIVAHYSNLQSGSKLGLAVLLAFAAAAAAGTVNGIMVSRVGIAPIVATIGMNALLYGVDVQISGGTPTPVPDRLSAFSNSKVAGVPTTVLIAVAAAVVVGFVVKKTVAGRRFEAVGASPVSARAAGLAPQRYQLSAYVVASCFYAGAGILLAGLVNMPSAFEGDFYLLPSIAAVVLGGTSLFGGVGNITASVIGALFLTQLQQLVLTTGASTGVQYLIEAAAIGIGVAVYSLRLGGLVAWLRKFVGLRKIRGNPIPTSLEPL